jgi:tight adherence protein B
VRTGLPEYNFLAITVGLQMQTGGNLAETLDNLAEMTRQRVALRSRVRALTAEARTSAKVLVALPFVIGAVSTIVAPQNLRILVGDPFGRQLLMFGIGLLIFGILTIRRMLRSASAE